MQYVSRETSADREGWVKSNQPRATMREIASLGVILRFFAPLFEEMFHAKYWRAGGMDRGYTERAFLAYFRERQGNSRAAVRRGDEWRIKNNA